MTYIHRFDALDIELMYPARRCRYFGAIADQMRGATDGSDRSGELRGRER